MSLASQVSRDMVRQCADGCDDDPRFARLRSDYGATFTAAYSASVLYRTPARIV
jgi:hypothetical protein